MSEAANSDPYRAPDGTRVGHIHLKVADLNRALGFYRDLLGFEITQRYGQEAVFLASGGYHHHIGLNIWYSKDAPPAPRQSAGLFHTAFLYPTRKDLAAIYRRLLRADYPLSGAADHGVSEALYLDDPDGNGVELYWDRPAALWPRNADGSLQMYTRPLDLTGLLGTLEEG
jgi:catechol 2,3-dioxygenase